MKVKLWQVKWKSKNPAYSGDHDELTVNARNVDEAIKKAKKVMTNAHAIYEVEWLATED